MKCGTNGKIEYYINTFKFLGRRSNEDGSPSGNVEMKVDGELKTCGAFF